MSAPSSMPVRLTQRLIIAQACCLCLGVALMVWSVAPAVMDRILTHGAPRWDTLMLGSASFLVGLAFVGMHASIRRGVRWALWTAFGMALSITTAAIASTMVMSGSVPASFALILAAATCVATWLALAKMPRSPSSKFR